VFGGQSTASRNKRVAELLDMGFRQAPSRVATRAPAKPAYAGPGQAAPPTAVASNGEAPGAAGKTIRVVVAPERSVRPRPRPLPEAPDAAIIVALENGIDSVVEDLVTAAAAPDAVTPEAPAPVAEAVQPEAVPPAALPAAAPVTVATAAPLATPAPAPRPAEIILASVEPAAPAPIEAQEIVTRMSTSGGRHWGITVGRFRSHSEAERVLLKTALAELATLGEALRKVNRGPQGFDANFVGLTQDGADLACRRLQARNTSCRVIGPS
jgi:D-alanyl-D-alanine carboxypeptidase